MEQVKQITRLALIVCISYGTGLLAVDNSDSTDVSVQSGSELLKQSLVFSQSEILSVCRKNSESIVRIAEKILMVDLKETGTMPPQHKIPVYAVLAAQELLRTSSQ
jgi:hypothetical protein